MSEQFKASNGWHTDGYGALHNSIGDTRLIPVSTNRVRQFFLEERDHELGRWRDTEVPQLVCYPSKDGYSVRVLSEDSGMSVVFYRDDCFSEAPVERVARRYFAAHPQHKPLPTKPGLYVGSPLRDALASARVYRLRDGEWSDVGRPESDPEVVCVAAQRLHDDDGLVRLVPEGGDDE